MCRHEEQHLIGTADGIRCRACGMIFNSFAELERDREVLPPAPPEDPPEDVTEQPPEDPPEEKPKKTRGKKTDA